jgi:hypothetical protein
MSLGGTLTPQVKVRDFAYATSSTKENTTDWARFSIDAAVAIVSALREAKQMGRVFNPYL